MHRHWSLGKVDTELEPGAVFDQLEASMLGEEALPADVDDQWWDGTTKKFTVFRGGKEVEECMQLKKWKLAEWRKIPLLRGRATSAASCLLSSRQDLPQFAKLLHWPVAKSPLRDKIRLPDWLTVSVPFNLADFGNLSASVGKPSGPGSETVSWTVVAAELLCVARWNGSRTGLE